jgi:hypothetical protein
MKKDLTHRNMARREFMRIGAGMAAATALGPLLLASSARAADKTGRMIGIQVGAVSFVDEGTEQVLDILQERGAVNTIFLAAFTFGRGIAGRQVPGQPLPDHGKQEYDEKFFHGGNYATPHEKFYARTVLKDTKAPDFGDLDILAEVVPKAHKRGIKVYCWYEDSFIDDIPNISELQSIDLKGRHATTPCPLNPDFREFLIGLTQDYCQSYDIDGVMWGSERQGPLHNAIGARHGGKPDSSRVTCFCEHHQKAAKQQGIDFARLKQGYEQLDQFVRQAQAGQRPNDGYFVEFWRLLLEFPEIIAWEKLWTENEHAIYADIHRAAKESRPDVQVGFHIWHANSFSPFYRAEQNYRKFAGFADYLKVVLYNNCGGPRYADYINNVGSTIFADVPKDELLQFHNHLLGYEEKPLAELPQAGMSADYVARETKRALADVEGKCKIYPGIDIDIPTKQDQKKTSPEDVYAATAAALKAGAEGVIFSRKYSEMRLDNLSAGGKAVRELLSEKA